MIVFRVDASQQLGFGHVMRCLTLARWLRRVDKNITFMCRKLAGDLISYIQEQGVAVLTLPAFPKTQLHSEAKQLELEILEAQQLLAKLGKPDWLICDHYCLGITWEQALRPFTKKLMVIDDFTDKAHECDLYFNQNFTDIDTRNLVPKHARTLLGPEFCLLRDEFLTAKNLKEKRTSNLKRIFVFMGGTDEHHSVVKVMRALKDPCFARIHIDIVVTNKYQANDEFYQLIKQDNFQLHLNPEALATLLQDADLAIGAPGSSTWERACLGIPTLLISFADNQIKIAEWAHHNEIADYLGDINKVQVSDITDKLINLIQHPKNLTIMAERACRVVDGLGKYRVLKAMHMEHYNINIVSDPNSWLNQDIEKFVIELKRSGHNANWQHKVKNIGNGDFAFYLSCGEIAKPEILSRNRHNLVVHASDLPKGKGWSPWVWQIIEGKNNIPITLLEAEASVDSGKIYLQETMHFSGHELNEELKKMVSQATFRLCSQFLNEYPDIMTQARVQTGEASFYPKRTAKDSKLDVNKTIAEQFNLLRTVDNKQYPAYFCYRNNLYKLEITKLTNDNE